ncbi:MAG: transporter, partial [Terracidiphilus sp.]
MKRILFAILLAVAVIASPSWGKEGGDQYPNGAENWFAGAIPPPGNYYVNYFGFYCGKLKGGSGANALLNGSTPSVDATFNALRFVEISHLKLLGADYGAHVIVPVVYQSVDMNGTASKTAIGDITVNPFILGWHHPRWHAVAAVDFFLPTGYYDKNDARVSIGSNYYGFDPLVAVSLLPKNGWEASAKLMYDLKTTNQATDYHSGQEFHTDYAAGKHFGNWMLGGTGYAIVQTTSDTQSGVVVPAAAGLWSEGRRGRVLAIGPSLGFQNKQHVIFLADWQHETLV